ncbi:hypothetical protein Tco_0105581 [Tanacetum coccineum]
MERITIKEYEVESEVFDLLKIDLDLFTCNTPLGIIFDEFKRLSSMQNDLFAYELGVLEDFYFPCVEQPYDNLRNSDLDVYEPRQCYDEYERMFAEVVILIDDRLQFEEYMEIKRRLEVNGLNINVECDPSNVEFAIWGDDEEILTNNELFKEEDLSEDNEIAEIDVDVLTRDLPGFKTYDDYKNAWIYKWNKEVPWVKAKPWSDNGTWKERLEDGDLKDEALNEKSILEGSWGHENREGNNFCSWLKESFGNYHKLDYELMMKLEEYWWGKKEEEESRKNACSNYLPNDDNDAIQTNQERFDDHEPMEDDDDIGNLDDYLIPQDASYYVDEEEEPFKERKSKLLGIPYKKPPAFKSEKFESVCPVCRCGVSNPMDTVY